MSVLCYVNYMYNIIRILKGTYQVVNVRKRKQKKKDKKLKKGENTVCML